MITIKNLLIKEIETENTLNNVIDNKRIVEKYKTLDNKSKDVVDDIFIYICGYSLNTLIEKSEKESL